jgi:hypothetical protein
MANPVIVLSKVQAQDIGAFNRSAVCAADVANGSIVVLTGKSATAGQSEVFTAVVPSTSDGLTGVWMAYSPEDVVTVSGSNKFKGLDPDPRNFTNLATYVFDVFKPKVGDLILMSEDCFTGARSTNTYANATDTTGGLKLVWGSTATSSVFSMHYLATSYISIPDGGISLGRLNAYLMEVVQE